MKLVRILSGLLAAACICAAFSGCGKNAQLEAQEKIVIEPMEKEPVCALSFDIIGGTDVMPIAG